MKVVASTGPSQTAPAVIHPYASEISSVESPELSSPCKLNHKMVQSTGKN